MFTVEKMKQTDFPFAVELANTMNWNMSDADFAFNQQMEPNGSLVLKEDSKPVGLSTCISYGKVGWFGNLIIDQVHRKHGAGTKLVTHAVTYLRSIGVTTIGLYAYTHLTNFYANIGFKTNLEFSVLKAERISKPDKSENLARLSASTKRDIPQLIELDAACFGASRTRLLTEILATKGNMCFVAKEKSKITGFATATVYDGLAEVGPLVCQRAHAKTAKSLLSAVLNKLEGSEAYMCLPSAETELIEESSKFGFKEEFRVVRMFLGFPVQKDCIYLAESLERG